MNEISPVDCTCGAHACYDCRRQEIDQTALYIVERELRICAGMHGFNITEHAHRQAALYRSKAINALATEFAH